MKVTLINPSWLIKEGSIWKGVSGCLPALGLASIASYLEIKGIDVDMIDIKAEGISDKELIMRIESRNPDFVGITATTTMINPALRIAEIIKNTNNKVVIVLGGVHPTVLPEETLKDPNVDVVVRNEGEVTFYELVSGKKKTEINGISYKIKGKVTHNPSRELIKDLDSLPYPAYHLLPIKNYQPSLGNYKRLPAISIMVSRGCPENCTFCSKKIFGRMFRSPSVDYITKEIKMLIKEYGIKEISFYDDAVTTNKGFVRGLCNKIIEDKIDITWTCMSRVDCLDSSLLELMKKAGCHQIGLGVESAEPKILDNINKRINLEQVEKVVKLIKKADIEVRLMFMFGNPGETVETIKKDIDYALKLDPDFVLFNITTPFPGTQIFEWAKENGYLKTFDWDKYDLSNIVMELPTIKPDKIKKYYKKAYRRFYIRPHFILKKILKIRSFTDFRNDFESFRAILRL